MSLRPGGVTGIAIIFLLGAAAFLAVGLVLLINPNFVKDFWDINIGPLLAWIPFVGSIVASINLGTWTLIGYAGIIVGIVDILIFIGLLKLKKWGYWLAIIISIPLIVVILGIIFIWYLRKDEVKAAFDIR
ncbi:MAG: hypothetical protein LUQ65_02995 [Candidatus Helarchaeota archaeon]|nr:hypothetical protein [Candidatus Helarchaeota archaeon]